MNMILAVGQVATVTGDYSRYNRAGEIIDVGAVGASDFAAAQPHDLPVLIDHNECDVAGHVVYLERTADHGLIAVAEVDPAVEEAERSYFSPSWTAFGRNETATSATSAVMSEISLVRQAATIGIRPVRFCRTNLRAAGGWTVGLPSVYSAALDRAVVWTRQRHAALEIQDPELDELLARSHVARSSCEKAIADRGITEVGRVLRHRTGHVLT